METDYAKHYRGHQCHYLCSFRLRIWRIWNGQDSSELQLGLSSETERGLLMQLCFATNNVHKLDEVKAIIDNKISIVSLKEIGCHKELAETSGTISGNSKQKAAYVFK